MGIGFGFYFHIRGSGRGEPKKIEFERTESSVKQIPIKELLYSDYKPYFITK